MTLTDVVGDEAYWGEPVEATTGEEEDDASCPLLCCCCCIARRDAADDDVWEGDDVPPPPPPPPTPPLPPVVGATVPPAEGYDVDTGAMLGLNDAYCGAFVWGAMVPWLTYRTVSTVTRCPFWVW